MNNLILTERQDTLFTITLNRPEKRNAISIPLFQALDAAVAEASRTPGLRAVLLRGAGKAFSSGIDVTALLTMAERYGPNWQQRMRQITDETQSVLTRLERLELPTIALLHGHCLGLALELALACDLRLAAEGCQLGLPETRLGIIPDVGGTTRLTRLIGPARAKELIFTGRSISAGQAAAWGIVNQVTPQDELRAQGEALAAEIAQAAPLAVGMAKRVIDGLADLDRGLQLEGWAQSQLFASEDFPRAVQAFLTRQAPDFEGR